MDRRVNKYLSDRDASRPKTPELFGLLLAASGWTAADGDCPGHWRIRRPGHRMISSCRWSTGSLGLLEVDQLLSVEASSVKQLVAEGLDVIARKEHSALNIAPYVCEYLGATITRPENWITGLENAIRTARQLYPEYVFAGDIPLMDASGNKYPMAGRLINLRLRPGWADRAAVLEGLGVAR